MFEADISSNVTTVLVFAVVGLFVWMSTRRQKGIPPGPLFSPPLVGNIFQIGKNPLVAFRKMKVKYGDIFSVYFGSRLVIVINGYENIKEAFVKNGDIFSGRPKMPVQDLLSKGKGIIMSAGHTWKEQRKFALVTLRNFGMGRNILESKIQEEIRYFTEELYNRRNMATDMGFVINNAVSNIICTIVFGKRFEYKDRKFLKFLKVLQENMSVSTLVDFLPILRFFPGDFLKIKRTISNIKQTDNEFIIPIIEEHEKNYDEDNIDDFISAYIKEIKSKESAGEENTSMDRENLLVTIGDLFLAGTETSSTTIRWLLLCFLYFPEIQEKCISEIESVVGSSRPVTLKDKSQLPYIEATVLEALRFGNIIPLGAPHTASVDTEFKGYTFPKGVIIFPNLESVLRDPKIWGDPENFRPERYIDEDGKAVVPEEHIPFFIGRRKCLGEALARMELFLFISNMIQKFKFVKVEGDTLPSLEGVFGLTNVPKSHQLKIIPRD